MQVRLPDGSIGQFPDDMSEQEIESVLQRQFPPAGEQGYIEQLTKGSPQRQSEMKRISSQYRSGDITTPEYVLQNLGEAAGNIGDVVGRGIGDVVGGAYGLLPQSTRESVAGYVEPAGQALAPVAQTIGDVYGKAKEEAPRLMENIEAGTNIALLGLPASQRAKQIGGAVGRAGEATIKKFLPSPKSLSSQDLKLISSEMYQKADNLGGVFKPEITNKFVKDVYKELPQTELGQIVAGENSATALARRLEGAMDKPMTLQAAKEIDEALGDLAYGSLNPATGQVDSLGKKFLDIQGKFRSAIESASDDMVVGGKGGYDALKDARNYWATSLRLADVEKAIRKGLATEQPQTGIKNQFKALLNSKKIMKYSPEEVRAIDLAANKGALTDLLGTFGSRLNPQIIGAAMMLAVDPATGLAAFLGQSAASAAARKVATGIQLKKASQVENLIRQRVGDMSGQKYALTPEINQLLQEVGIMSLPSGGISELLNQLQEIQQTGTIQGNN